MTVAWRDVVMPGANSLIACPTPRPFNIKYKLDAYPLQYPSTCWHVVIFCGNSKFSRLPSFSEWVADCHTVAKAPQKAIFVSNGLPADWTCFAAMRGTWHTKYLPLKFIGGGGENKVTVDTTFGSDANKHGLANSLSNASFLNGKFDEVLTVMKY